MVYGVLMGVLAQIKKIFLELENKNIKNVLKIQYAFLENRRDQELCKT